MKSLRVRNALRAGFCLFLCPKAQQKGVTVFECGANALMDGAIVAVVHDEFRGMGLSGVQEFLEGGGTGDVGG